MIRRVISILSLLCVIQGLIGCRSTPARHAVQSVPAEATAADTASASARPPFTFLTDTLAFPNKTLWHYDIDPISGKQSSRSKSERPDYTGRCLLLVRAARQFYYHARFDPEATPPNANALRESVRAILNASHRVPSSESEKILLPGYADLHDLSQDQEPLLKTEFGSAWRSYVDPRNVRMIRPFSRNHQKRTAQKMRKYLLAGSPVIVRIVRFPALTINHALLCYGVREDADRIVFDTYDPNIPDQPVELVYHHADRSFTFQPTFYFKGGPVNVYQIHRPHSMWLKTTTDAR